jgi:hypothetical protein
MISETSHVILNKHIMSSWMFGAILFILRKPLCARQSFIHSSLLSLKDNDILDHAVSYPGWAPSVSVCLGSKQDQHPDVQRKSDAEETHPYSSSSPAE